MAIAIAIYAWRSLPKGKIRALFILSFLLMSVYKFYDPNTDSLYVLWGRHIFVYAGEIVFYFFIVAFSRRYIEIEGVPIKPSGTVLRLNLLVLLPIMFFGSGITWWQYVSDAGLPHILTLPIFVFVVALVRLRLTLFDSKYTRVVALFTIALGGWILIHISEFIGESQKVLYPGLNNFMPNLEAAWYYVGAILFVLAIRSFKKVEHVKK